MSVTPARAIGTNTTIQAGGRLLVSGLTVAAVAILTRYLGAEQFGTLALALTYVSLFAIGADFGLFTIIVRELSRETRPTSELIGNVISLRLILGAAFIGAGGLVSLLLPYDGEVRIAILITAVPIFTALISSCLVALFQARLQMSVPVIADVLGRVVTLGAVAAVATFNLGFFAAVATAIAGAIVTLMIVAIAAGRRIQIRPRGDLATWRMLVANSWPLGVALALNQVYSKADILLLSVFRPLSEVGHYAVAYRILELVLGLSGVFILSVFPVLSRAVHESDSRARETLQKAIDVLIVAGVPVAIGGVIVAPHLIDVVAGSGFSGAVVPLQILLGGIVLTFVNGMLGYAMIARDRQRSALWLNVVGTGFNIAGNFLLIPIFGLMAAAATTVASEFVILVGSYLMVRRYYGFAPRFHKLWPAAIVGLGMGVILWPLRDLSLVLLVPIGGFIYGAAMFATGSLLPQRHERGGGD